MSIKVYPDRVQRDIRLDHRARVCVYKSAKEHALARHVLVPLYDVYLVCDRRGICLSVVECKFDIRARG